MNILPSEILGWVKANYPYRLRSNNWLQICNPLQEKVTGSKDTKFRLNINLESGYVHDWRPNHQYCNCFILKFIQKLTDCSYNEAVQIIKSAKPVDVNIDTENSNSSIREVHLELPKLMWSFDNQSKFETIALNYLKSRSIDKDIAKQWGICYGVDSIIFPYIEYDEIVYWQSRDISSKRFLFPKDTGGMSKGKLFYGWHMAEPQSTLYITESLFGAVSIGPGGLASGGATLTEHQAQKLAVLNPTEIILCPDNDDAGLASLIHNYYLLKQYSDKLYYCVPPTGNNVKDWNEFIKFDNVKSYINNNKAKLTITVIAKIQRDLTRNQNNIMRKD